MYLTFLLFLFCSGLVNCGWIDVIIEGKWKKYDHFNCKNVYYRNILFIINLLSISIDWLLIFDQIQTFDFWFILTNNNTNQLKSFFFFFFFFLSLSLSLSLFLSLSLSLFLSFYFAIFINKLLFFFRAIFSAV